MKPKANLKNKKASCLLIGFAVILSILYTQETQAVNIDPEIPVDPVIIDDTEFDEVFAFAKVDEMPEFPGGMDKLQEYLSSNINYPQDAVKAGIYGRVHISFVVEKDGSITDVQIAKSVHPSLDEEALRVVKKMPKWTPGILHNKPVRVRYVLPLRYVLPKL